MYHASGDNEWVSSVTVTMVSLAATAVSGNLSFRHILTLTYSIDVPLMNGKPATLFRRYLRAISIQRFIPISKTTLSTVLKTTLSASPHSIPSIPGRAKGTPGRPPSEMKDVG